MKCTFISIVFYFLTLNIANCQQGVYQGSLVVYPTYAHYVGDSGVFYTDNYILKNLMLRTWGVSHYYFKTQEEKVKDRKKVHLSTRKIWGFQWGNSLYRISPRNYPLYVSYKEDVVYYELLDEEDGVGLINPIWTPEEINNEVSDGFISKDLGSELILVKRRGWRRNPARKQVEVLLHNLPNKDSCLECLDYSQTMAGIRACFELLDKQNSE